MRVHNRDKTHCPHGHEYSTENTRLVGGKRHCITCHRKRNLESYYRRQEITVPAGTVIDEKLLAEGSRIFEYDSPTSDTSHDSSGGYSSDTGTSSTDTTSSSDTFNGGGGGDFGGGGASGDY